jgi:hypothetical protein
MLVANVRTMNRHAHTHTHTHIYIYIHTADIAYAIDLKRS